MKTALTQLLLLFAALVATGMAQEGGQEAIEETDQDRSGRVGGLAFADEIEVTVVNVDVYVRDRNGDPVTGLGIDDFKVFQNGVEMEVTNFADLNEEVIRHRMLLEAEQERVEIVEVVDETPAAPEIKPIWVVLYIDNENIEALDRNRVMRRVREFVVENLDQPVRIMVMSYQRSLKVLQPFTSDSREVTAALRGLVRETGGREHRESERRIILRDMADAVNRDYGTQRDTQAGAKMDMRQRVTAYAAEEANNLTFTIGGLRQAVAMLSGIEGRKSVIYVSSGLPIVPGIGLMHDFAMTFHDQSIMSLRGRFDQTRLFHELTSMANAQEVSLYSIDASGLNPLDGFEAENSYSRDPTASSIGSKNYQDSLRYMAEGTGGIAIVNTNDVLRGLERISTDLYNYYSIGYAVNSSGEDRVHRIKVELTGDKKYDLRFRRRFVEKSVESRVQDRVFTSLVVDIDDNPMDLELEAETSIPGTGTQWLVPLHLSLALDKVVLLPEQDELVGRVVVVIGARDEDGRNSEVQRQEHEIRLPKDEYMTSDRKRFGIDFRLILTEGRHRVAVGVMDPITRQASYARQVVSVP